MCACVACVCVCVFACLLLASVSISLMCVSPPTPLRPPTRHHPKVSASADGQLYFDYSFAQVFKQVQGMCVCMYAS